MRRIEERCAAAIVRVDSFINARAEELSDQVHRDFTRLRATLGLRRLLDRNRPYRMPRRFLCPDCGGRVLVEIDEWTTEGRRVPTQGGFRLMCEPDTIAELAAWADGEDYEGHPYGYDSAWMGLERQVGKWLVRNCEVSS